VSADAGGGVQLQLNPRFLIRAQAGAGYYYAVINRDGTSGANASLSAGLGLTYLINPSIDVGLGASYRNYLGLYHGVSISVGTLIHLTGREMRKERIDSTLPIRPELLIGAKADRPDFGIDLDQLELDEVFPVFKNYYDDHALGRAVLINMEQTPISDIKLSFFARQYMDGPKECAVPVRLEPGESVAVELTSLFSDRILDITEGTKATAEVVLEYRHGGDLYRDARNVTVRLLDRNAMRWEDDRRAAAFVTAKDPKVLAFAKNAVGLVRGQGPQAIDATLLGAMAVFKALDLYGLSYVVDPKTPFVEFSKNRQAVDYLQFPRQTLEYRAGDCDDLSILYAALLESVGIETAFITVPGHIYTAFAISISPEEVERSYSSTADFIVRERKVWVPVEVTVRQEGFLRAWQEGARQWREAVAKNTAGFLPVHEAWKEYEPVGLPGGSGDVGLPPADQILAAFSQEADRLIEREIAPKVARLEAEINSTGGSPVAHNRLGILYAKYGRLEKAEEAFTKAMGRGGYTPAQVNLGNLYFLRKDLPRAQLAYEKAAAVEPGNPTVMVNLARIYHEQEKYELAADIYERLVLVDADVASRHAYLGRAKAEARAGAAGEGEGGVEWREE
jgi:tetratricopeptide (TPR) repeat protein